MATLKAVVRKQRADGFYAVYIRIVHRSRMGYIKTDKVIYNTPRFSDRHNYGGMTRNRYICKKEENQNGKTI